MDLHPEVRSEKRLVWFVLSALVGGWASALASAPTGALAQPSASASATSEEQEVAAPPREAWTARYADARKSLLRGEYAAAATAFSDLAKDSGTDADRALATEMARLAAEWAANGDGGADVVPPKVRPPVEPKRAIRTRDELSLLYASAFLYGAGTGGWFLLQTQPDTAIAATLPFIGITAAPLIGIALVDGYKPLRHGLPHALSAGLYLGLGEGIWIVGYEHASAHRLEAVNASPRRRWTAETVSSALWGGATVGAVAAGFIGSTVPLTPGRVSFTASVTSWSGVLVGFATGALAPDNAFRTENAMIATGIAYNAGLVGGLIAAGPVSPSVTRVRLADLAGIAGGVIAGGAYLALSNRDADPRAALGMSALGAGSGLALGWIVTTGMDRDLPSSETPKSEPPPVTSTWRPMVWPTSGGGLLSVGGSL